MKSAFGVVHKSFLPKQATGRSGYIKAINLTGKEKDRLKTNISRRRRLRPLMEKDVAKSYKKLQPNLIQTTRNLGLTSRSETMETRVVRNYASFRNKAGKTSKVIQEDQRLERGGPALKPFRIKQAKKLKEMANASVTAAGNMNRKTRVLP